MTNMSVEDFAKLRKKIEEETGFVTFEPQFGSFAPQTSEQMVWYGTSDKLADFKTLIADNVQTGTVAYCIDTKSYEMYSTFKKAWF